MRTEVQTRRPQRRGPHKEVPASVRQARAARRGNNEQPGQLGRVVKAADSELKVSGSSPGGPFRWQRPHARQHPHSVCPLTARRPQAGTPHARKAAVATPGLAAAGTPEGRPIRPRGRPRTARCGRACSPRSHGTAAGTPRLRTSGHGESRRPHGGPQRFELSRPSALLAAAVPMAAPLRAVAGTAHGAPCGPGERRGGQPATSAQRPRAQADRGTSGHG